MMSERKICILAMESSCDETSASVSVNNKILSNIIAGQKVHELYGGVVPELASRAHQQNIIPVVDAALKNAGLKKEELHAVAFTKGPGLIGSLMVGVSFAKSFALSLNIPLIEVNHMQAHVLANFAITDDNAENNFPQFPFLCLTVSGGHTQIVLVKSFYDMEIIGETQDDAAGEAFDKIAKALNIPYPGGPLIDKLAQFGNENTFRFPHPHALGFNFSFSGLKTAVLYFIRDHVKMMKHLLKKIKMIYAHPCKKLLLTFYFPNLKKLPFSIISIIWQLQVVYQPTVYYAHVLQKCVQKKNGNILFRLFSFVPITEE